MGYTSVCLLKTLGDDFSRLDIQSLISGMKLLQQKDGSFSATLEGSECDTRFIYCACAISSILNDWSGINIDLATSYILNCFTYDGGISLVPGAEAHGGSCYCGLASLVLMGRLGDVDADNIDRLKHWCMQKQIGGYQGRTNKSPDTCYSFWIGATLSLLDAFHLTDLDSTREFILHQCQSHPAVGGFSKTPGAYPDILHTFYSLCWLSMEGSVQGLRPIHPALGICSYRL